MNAEEGLRGKGWTWVRIIGDDSPRLAKYSYVIGGYVWWGVGGQLWPEYLLEWR